MNESRREELAIEVTVLAVFGCVLGAVFLLLTVLILTMGNC